MKQIIYFGLFLLTSAVCAQAQSETVCTPDNTKYYYVRAHQNPIVSDGLATYRKLGFPNEVVTCAVDDHARKGPNYWEGASRRQIQVSFTQGSTPVLVTFDETVIRVRLWKAQTDITKYENRTGEGLNLLECTPPTPASKRLECVLNPDNLGKVNIVLNAPQRDAADLAMVVDYKPTNTNRQPEGKMTWGNQTLPLVRVGTRTQVQQANIKARLGHLYQDDALILTLPNSNQALVAATKYPGFVIHAATDVPDEVLEQYGHIFEAYYEYPVPSQHIFFGNMIFNKLTKAYEIGN